MDAQAVRHSERGFSFQTKNVPNFWLRLNPGDLATAAASSTQSGNTEPFVSVRTRLCAAAVQCCSSGAEAMADCHHST